MQDTQKSCLPQGFAEHLRRLQNHLAEKSRTAVLHDRLWILISDLAWSKPKIFDQDVASQILDQALHQQRPDGGIALKDLGIPPKNSFAYQSDSYATSLVAVASLMSKRSDQAPQIAGLETWLNTSDEQELFSAFSYNRPETAWNNLLFSDLNRGLWLFYRKVRATRTTL